MDKLVEIDPYDFRNQQRLTQLEGAADPALVSRIRSRLAQVATHSPQQASGPEDSGQEESAAPALEKQELDDLMVQAEIFLQYALQSKAVEKLEQIAQLFPGEEEHNPRLRNLYQMAGWWPGGRAAQPAAAAARPAAPAVDSGDTLRDLAKISEISQSLHRQASAKAMVATAIQEVGQYMRATRCFAAVGAAGRPPQMASEYCAPGVEAAPGAALVRLLAQLEQTAPDGLGGLLLQQKSAPVLATLGLDSALGVPVLDPETKAQTGLMVAGYAAAHAWRPHEKYFLQAVGDQMLLGVNHTRLRTMARTLGAADEKTGLLTRSSYLECLVQEAQRAKVQGTPLTLALVQMDHGAELLREHGEAAVERYLEQLARTLQPVTRQSDLAIKYTSWAIAFILPDTPQAAGESQAEKIKQAGAGLRPPWNGDAVGLSASVAEAVTRPDFDSEDIVSELINRAESGLDEARRRGGGAVVTLGAPSLRA
jgi:diguanylate cyclase (GGDEF)-like protein